MIDMHYLNYLIFPLHIAELHSQIGLQNHSCIQAIFIIPTVSFFSFYFNMHIPKYIEFPICIVIVSFSNMFKIRFLRKQWIF